MGQDFVTGGTSEIFMNNCVWYPNNTTIAVMINCFMFNYKEHLVGDKHLYV